MMNDQTIKIGIIVGHPTQFEGPFYRYLSRDPNVCLRVIYMDGDRIKNVYDDELKKCVDWGIDLLGGYDFKIISDKSRFSWLTEEIKSGNYDLLILNGYNRLELLWALIVGRFYGVKVALRLDSVCNPRQHLIKRILKRILLPILFSGYHALLGTSRATRAYLRSLGVGERKIFYFTYAVDQEWFRLNSTLTELEKQKLKDKLGIQPGRKVVLAVSKFATRETPWDLLHALSLLKSDCVCLLVGDGPDRGKIDAFVSENPHVTLILPGYVPYPKLPGFYGISDVFVHAALEEPYGVSVAEALSSGVPVIASSRVGAAYDLVEDGVSGKIYQVGDPDDLAIKLDYFLGKKEGKHYFDEAGGLLAQWNYETTALHIKECAGFVAGQRNAHASG